MSPVNWIVLLPHMHAATIPKSKPTANSLSLLSPITKPVTIFFLVNYNSTYDLSVHAIYTTIYDILLLWIFGFCLCLNHYSIMHAFFVVVVVVVSSSTIFGCARFRCSISFWCAHVRRTTYGRQYLHIKTKELNHLNALSIFNSHGYSIA